MANSQRRLKVYYSPPGTGITYLSFWVFYLYLLCLFSTSSLRFCACMLLPIYFRWSVLFIWWRFFKFFCPRWNCIQFNLVSTFKHQMKQSSGGVCVLFMRRRHGLSSSQLADRLFHACSASGVLFSTVQGGEVFPFYSFTFLILICISSFYLEQDACMLL